MCLARRVRVGVEEVISTEFDHPARSNRRSLVYFWRRGCAVRGRLRFDTHNFDRLGATLFHIFGKPRRKIFVVLVFDLIDE